jgi:hypothetical protein
VLRYVLGWRSKDELSDQASWRDWFWLRCTLLPYEEREKDARRPEQDAKKGRAAHRRGEEEGGASMNPFKRINDSKERGFYWPMYALLALILAGDIAILAVDGVRIFS